ncbi:MAG TPA: DUF4349 domain-containing protein [Polyangiaceae bacterium]|jgi:hypothetical protein|nr:DUF4349 domain-containing protein [Polyangiaceae bacterium]
MGLSRRPLASSLVVVALVMGGCALRKSAPGSGSAAAKPAPLASAASPARAAAVAQSDGKPASDEVRRIVKKASLELEVKNLGDAQAAASRIAEHEGGFVASTERQAVSGEEARGEGAVTLTLRVPAAHFSSALEGLRRLGTGTGSERITTEDVSEETIDLDARIRVQRELEAQFLEILKRASKVEDALNVQREMAGVRTEIERMEGRRRFLEHQTALSTISVALAPPRPLVRASFSDFSSSVVHAASDSVNLGAGIVTVTIRALGVLVPLTLLFALPLAFAIRSLRRRTARRLAAAEA